MSAPADVLAGSGEQTPKCVWAPEDHWGSDVWNSSCGVTYQFMADGPTENGHKFCHACGRTLQVESPMTREQQAAETERRA